MPEHLPTVAGPTTTACRNLVAETGQSVIRAGQPTIARGKFEVWCPRREVMRFRGEAQAVLHIWHVPALAAALG